MTMPSTIHRVDRAPVRADDPETSQHAADTVDVPASRVAKLTREGFVHALELTEPQGGDAA